MANAQRERAQLALAEPSFLNIDNVFHKFNVVKFALKGSSHRLA
jgi:hypothetical protein